MYKEWLKEKMTVEEIERHELETCPVKSIAEKFGPFGYANESWEALKADMRPGDEVWSFSSDQYSWSMLCGRTGYSLVRDGEVVGSIVTMMS